MNLNVVERHGLAAGGIRVLEVIGELNMGSVDVLHECIGSAFKDGTRKIIIDMGKTEGFSSAGWGCLVEWQFRVKLDGGAIVISSMKETQAHVYELMGINATIDRYDDLPAAIRAFKGGGNGN